MTATTRPDTEFTVPPPDTPLTPTRVRALGDTLRIHHRLRSRGNGYDTVPVETLIERLAVELENRDRREGALAAAADRANEAVDRWRQDHKAENGDTPPPGPSTAEVHTMMQAQWQADQLLARGQLDLVSHAIPAEPDRTADMATDVLAQAHWLSAAVRAAREHVDALRSAVPAAEQQVHELTDRSDRLAQVLTLASAVLPGTVIDVPEIELTEAS